MRHGSLFSGIGGFDLAAEWMGWENIFHCEWNEFGQRVLKYYWPGAKSYEDITKTDFTIHRGQIDILTGGFPCQPYSTAGKRLGKEDDRHLWPEMLRAIREIQPSWIVGENVYGLTNWDGGLVFEEVQADLEAEGYEVQPIVLPAASVGAPHRRDRVWFVAYSSNTRIKGLRQQRENEIYGFKSITNSYVCYGKRKYELGRYSSEEKRDESKESELRERIWIESGNNGKTRDASNSECQRQQEQRQPERSLRQEAYKEWKASWSYDDGRWPTQPPICSGNDGFSEQLDGITFPKWRQESIKAYGNAIVPQVALQIFKVIELMNEALAS